MEAWRRDDGRFYYALITEDLFGLVVMIAYGGRTPARVRSVPVSGLDEGERVLAAIARRRLVHGYERHVADVARPALASREASARGTSLPRDHVTPEQ